MNSSSRSGALFAAVACVLVGASFTAGGALVHYPHAGGQALRYGVAFLLLAGAARRQEPGRLRALGVRQWALAAAVAAVGMVGFNLSVLAAERTAQPAVPGVLVGCAPVVVAVLVPLAAGRRPGGAVSGGAVLVAAGAFAVQGWGGTDGRGLAWSVAALGGEVGFALLAAPLVRPLGPLLLSTCVCGFAAVEAAVLAAAGDGFRTPTGPEALALGWQAVIATVIGFVCWYAGFQRLGTERATLFSGLIPVSAALTAPVVSVGTLGAGQLAGSALVAAGVALGSGALRGMRALHGMHGMHGMRGVRGIRGRSYGSGAGPAPARRGGAAPVQRRAGRRARTSGYRQRAAAERGGLAGHRRRAPPPRGGGRTRRGNRQRGEGPGRGRHGTVGPVLRFGNRTVGKRLCIYAFGAGTPPGWGELSQYGPVRAPARPAAPTGRPRPGRSFEGRPRVCRPPPPADRGRRTEEGRGPGGQAGPSRLSGRPGRRKARLPAIPARGTT